MAIRSSRTAWFSAARNVARIRSKVDALIGSPYRFRRRPNATNIRVTSRRDNSASLTRPRNGIRCSRT
ncbi:hypothetical protein [Nonomuraea sp. NPDC049695]|uniref:hypothetical protein n=1 Tax=Nonomuraea sp. NPDC049695 TaxID=3154734 RepID=UPI003426FBB2